MISSLPAGFTIRAPTWNDVDAATDVLLADERAARGSVNWDAGDTREWLSQADFEENAWVVETEGRLVAVGAVNVRGELFDGWFIVHPEYTGRGVGSALVRIAEDRARELGARSLRLGTLAENVGGRMLLEEAGYRDVRHYIQMQIQLDGLPSEPAWTEGVTVAPFDLGEARALHVAINDAFADEWNFHPRPFEDWAKHRLEAEDFDPTLWFIAHSGDEIAAFALCYPMRWGSPHVGLLGVRKPWRRRGLGLALLHQAFGEFYRRGERKVGLGVDALNPTGATRLYERAGMSVHTEDVVYERELT
ncbi:MAG: GNAT family N-acetyltransferase [Gaiellaceae bacterium]